MREVVLELDDVADVGAAERIDRLVGVADHGERRARDLAAAAAVRLREAVLGLEIVGGRGIHLARQLANERVLRVVGVLVLVDEDVPEPATIQRRHGRERPEQVDGLRDQVVEVERVRLRQRLRVPAEDLDEPGLVRVVEVGRARVGLDVGELVLGLRDLAEHTADREAEGVGIQLLDDALDEGARVGRVVDGEALREPEVLGLAPQDAHARRVERRDPHALRRLAADQRADPVAHLGRRLVRERDGENLARPRLVGLQQSGDATSEHAGLARPRTRHDQQRLAAVEHRLALLRVEPLEQLLVGLGRCTALGPARPRLHVLFGPCGRVETIENKRHNGPSLGGAGRRWPETSTGPRGPEARDRAGRRRRRRRRTSCSRSNSCCQRPKSRGATPVAEGLLEKPVLGAQRPGVRLEPGGPRPLGQIGAARDLAARSRAPAAGPCRRSPRRPRWRAARGPRR